MNASEHPKVGLYPIVKSGPQRSMPAIMNPKPKSQLKGNVMSARYALLLILLAGGTPALGAWGLCVTVLLMCRFCSQGRIRAAHQILGGIGPRTGHRDTKLGGYYGAININRATGTAIHQSL